MRYAKIRSFVGTCVLGGVVVAAFVGFPFSGCNYLKIGFLRFVCPVGFIETTLASHTIAWKLAPGFLIECGLMLILGRTYCSWFCPAAHARGKSMGFVMKFLPITLTRKIERKWRGFKLHSVDRLHLGFRDGLALILGGAAGIAIFGYPFFCLWCPIGILSRSLIELGKHYTMRWELVLLVVPLALGFFFENGWKCLCPVGSFRGLVAIGNRSFVPAIHFETCKRCNKCGRECPSGISPMQGPINTMRCIKCFKCIDTCPQRAMFISMSVRRKS